MDKLIAAHPLEMPSKLVEHRTRRLLETTMRDMLVRGIDPRGEEINWENMSRLLRSQAEHDLRGSLLLERIADAENIEVTDEEIETEIKEIAEASRQTPEQVRAALTKQGGERSIADRLRQRKALDFIIEHAHVSDEEWREEDLKANAERAKAATESGEQATGSANSEASAGVSETEGQPLKQS